MVGRVVYIKASIDDVLDGESVLVTIDIAGKPWTEWISRTLIVLDRQQLPNQKADYKGWIKGTVFAVSEDGFVHIEIKHLPTSTNNIIALRREEIEFDIGLKEEEEEEEEEVATTGEG